MEYKVKIDCDKNGLRKKKILQNRALHYYDCNDGVVFITNDVFDYSKLLLMEGSSDVSATLPVFLWNKNDISSMMRAQQEINKSIINFGISKNIKDKLILLDNDITTFYTSTCHVCGDLYSKNRFDFNKYEHIEIETSWGYNSTHDCETHKLVLCNKCYDNYILGGILGEYVKRKCYM